MRLGILRFQGDVREHYNYFERAGADVEVVIKAEQLKNLDGFVIPGGESTTISKFIFREGWDKAIKDFVHSGKAVFATCAGLILLARSVAGQEVDTLGLLDAVVERNAYGRQKESFEADIKLNFSPEKPFRAVFIRAPKILEIGKEVEILASVDDSPVLVTQGKILAASFHPELTDDLRIAEYFIKKVAGED